MMTMTMRSRWLLLLALFLIHSPFFINRAGAQQRLHVHMTDRGAQWDFPVVVDSIRDMTLSDDLAEILFNVTSGAAVPFERAKIDSLTIGDEPGTITLTACRMQGYTADKPLTLHNPNARVRAIGCVDKEGNFFDL